MARATPTIREGILIAHEAGQTTSIGVGSEQWFAWLHKETSTSFSFHIREGSYTARKDRVGNRRGGWYWKAYRKRQGTLYRAYLGKPEDLTLARLSEIALALSQRTQGKVREDQDISAMEQRNHRQMQHEASVMPLLETRLHPPQLPVVLVERSGLLTRLDASLAHKLTLLLAPAGFGKTTLVNQWLAARSTSSTFPALAWVSLDASDNDPLRFWRAVITACQRLPGPEQQAAGQAALALLTTPIHPPFEQAPIEIALTRLLNALAETSSGGLLVLDDYHVISEQRLHETLAFFIEHLPATVHMLLLSRAEPALPLLRWRARGQLCELHTFDLRFSSQETASFLHQALPVYTLSEQVLARLHISLEGWAAGLRLLCLTLARSQSPQAVEQALLSLSERADCSSPHRALLDYFVSEILETQPEPMQRFLLQTSMLSQLCGPLCDAVTGGEKSAEQLEAIERAGLFLEALEGPGAWYRYHALFAEAMRREASRRMGEEALRALSQRASSWYEQEGLLTEAIEAAGTARDMERMARLIERVNEQSFSEPLTMLRWLEQLPDAVLLAHPLLCHLFAVELRFPVELRFSQTAIPVSEVGQMSEVEHMRIETLLQMAEECWQRQGEFAWIGANQAFRVLSALLDQEPFSVLLNYARQALAFLPQEEAPDRRLRMYRSTCRLFVGIDKLRQGQVDEARQLLLQAQTDNVPPGNRYLATDIRLALGKSHLIRGELQQARRYQQQTLVDSRDLDDDEMTADALLELAWLAFEWNDLKGAEQQAREALEVAQRVHPQRPELYDRAELQLALLQHLQGETHAALEQLTALLADPPGEWTPSSLWLLARLRDWQGRLLIATGDLQAVQKSLEAQSHSIGTSLTEYLGEEILRGRLLLAQGEIKAALQQFARLLPTAQEHLHQYAALEIQLLLALAHAAYQQEQQSHYWLRQTLLQAVHEGYIRLFLNEGKPMLALLRSLLPSLQHDATLRSYAHTILRAATQRTGAPHTSRLVSDGPPFEPLSTQEQRVLRLLVVGRNNQEIARELIISVNTVKYHIKHLYQKLGVSNRLQASEAARRLKLDESV